MAQVSIIVNGRGYQVGCDEGEEDKVQALGQALDERVQQIAQAVGQVGEARLMLLASLTMADDLAEAQAENEALRNALKNAKEQPLGDGAADLAALAKRLEVVAERLEGA